jgi:hypothetical protein
VRNASRTLAVEPGCRKWGGLGFTEAKGHPSALAGRLEGRLLGRHCWHSGGRSGRTPVRVNVVVASTVWDPEAAHDLRHGVFLDAGETRCGAAFAAKSNSERRTGVGRWFWCRPCEWRNPLL